MPNPKTPSLDHIGRRPQLAAAQPATPVAWSPAATQPAAPHPAPSHAIRWLIRFELLVKAPLHLGSGEQRLLDESEAGLDGERAFSAALVLDQAGNPSLPGASIKGTLLARLRAQCGALPAWALPVFGHIIDQPGPDQHPNAPGCAEFRRATWAAGQPDAARRIETRTAINRFTATAEDGKLFSRDSVQPGARFIASIVLQQASREQVGELHALLAGCNEAEPLQIGAHQRAGWGSVVVEHLQVGVLPEESLASWWQQGLPNNAKEVLPWDDKAFLRPVAATEWPARPHHPSRADQLRLPLALQFDGPFAVRDSIERKSGNSSLGTADSKPRQRGGKPLLPATSLLGSLRARAEYILRTLGTETPAGHNAPGVRTGAWPIDLCSLLFGCTGWRGLVGASGDFIGTESMTPMQQHMVALCRITGGGQDHAKFLFECYESPTLVGQLTLDRLRLQDPKLKDAPRDAALGLLHLLLLDLTEGDIGFGMARSKGWGWVKRQTSVMEDIESHWWRPLAPASDGPEGARLIAALHAKLGVSSRPAEAQQQPTGHAAEAAPAPGLPDSLRPPMLFRGPGQKGQKFHNPYHFLPFAKLRGMPPVAADTAEAQPLAAEALAAGHAHDRAQPGRYSGRLVVGLRTVSPLFIGAKRSDNTAKNKPVEVDAFVYQRKRALPGTSLRGMLSALLEPITGSAMRIIDAEHGLSMRASASKEDILKPGLVVLAENKSGERVFCVKDEKDKLRAINPQAVARLYALADERWRAVGSKLKLDTAADVLNKGGGELPLYMAKPDRKGKDGAMKKGKVGLLPAIDWKRADGSDRDEFVWPRNSDPERLGSRARLMPRQVIYYRLGASEQVEELAWSPIYRRIGWADTARDPGPLTIARLVGMDNPGRLPLGRRPDPRLHAAEWLLGVVEQNVPEGQAARAFASRLSVGIALPAGGAMPKLCKQITLKELSTPKPPSPALYLKRRNDASGAVDKASLMARPGDFAFHGTKTYLHAWRDDATAASA